MQQIKVKEVKVRTGTNAKDNKPWMLVILIAEDDSEFRTFDKKLEHLPAGSVIELEPVIKEGKTNFSEYKIIHEGPASPPSAQIVAPVNIEALRLEIASRERIAAFQGIMGLAGNVNIPMEGELKNAYDAALGWAVAYFGGSVGKETAPVKAEAKKELEKAVEESLHKSIINWPDIAESLKTLRDRDPEKWNDDAVLTYMVKTYKVDGASVQEAAAKLDRGKAEHFVKKIQEALDGRA